MTVLRIGPRFMGFDMTLYDMAKLSAKQRRDAQRIQDKAGLLGKALDQAPGANVHLHVSPSLTGVTISFDEAVWNSPEAKAARPPSSDTVTVHDRRQGFRYSSLWGHQRLIRFVNDAIRHAIQISRDPYMIMEHPAPPWPRVSHSKTPPKAEASPKTGRWWPLSLLVG